MKKIFPPFEYVNVPNGITTLGLVFAIGACYFITRQDFRLMAVCLFFCAVMDLVDGWFATKLNQHTILGKHIDTLVDYFTCVIMPVWILLLFFEAPSPIIIAGLVLYCICGTWRLSYYNISGKGEYFSGIPVPASMMAVIITFWGIIVHGLPEWVIVIAFVIIGPLMISGVKLKKYGIWHKSTAAFGVIAFLLIIIF